MELAGTPPSGNLLIIYPTVCGESCSQGGVSGSTSPQNHPKREVWGEAAGHWVLLAALHCRILVLEKPPERQKPAKPEHGNSPQNSVLQRFPHSLYWHRLTTASWRRKLYERPRSILSGGKKGKLELTGSELVTSTLYNLRKSRHCLVCLPKTCLHIPDEYYHF